MNIVRIPVLLSALFLLNAKRVIGQPYNVTITTMIAPPVSASINQAISNAANTIRITFHNSSTQTVKFKVWGKIEQLTSPNIGIGIDVVNAFNTNSLPEVELIAGATKMLQVTDLKRAFGNFSESLIKFFPPDARDQLREGLNYKLPEGQYRLCVMAGTSPTNYVADPLAQGCGYFTICKLSPPQFVQPVNNLNVNAGIPTISPTSPLAFTWVALQGSCGIPSSDLTYNLEIREILDNQTINDAVNNPFVFYKPYLRASTFLLDSNLNRNVLVRGKKYAMRVQAVIKNGTSPLSIENNGYSRMEAFQYGTASDQTVANTGDADLKTFMIDNLNSKIQLVDSIYTAYTDHKRTDTLIPVKEYIALQLTENGIAYNLDAIELFLALNPDLKTAKLVKLSQISRLPDFPKPSTADEQQFDREIETNTLPDPAEEKIFKSYLDSLHNVSRNQKFSAGVLKIAIELETHLKKFNEEVSTINRVSVNFVNRLLAEFLQTVNQKGASVPSENSRLQGIAANIVELTTEPPGKSLSMHSLSEDLRTLLCYYKPQQMGSNKQQAFLSNYNGETEDTRGSYYVVRTGKQLLSFEVVVWRYSKDAPPQPVSNAPDLNKVYRIIYTTPALFNERNPEINSISSSQLASTTVISLPGNSAYYIWGQNMLNHQVIKPQKFDINGVFLLSNKKDWPDSKNYRIILKAN
jgi:hypothetical protein